GSSCRDPHHELAEVSPLEQADEGLRRLFEAFNHILAIAHATLVDPPAHLFVKSRALLSELALDEAADAERLGQYAHHHRRQAVRAGEGFARVILRDESANRDAREVIEQRKDRVPNLAAHIFEIDVDTLGAGRHQALSEVGGAMVHRRVEAELIAKESAFLRA